MKHQLPRTRSGRPSRSKAAREWRVPFEALSITDVERRVIRALKTIRALPDSERRFLDAGKVGLPMWRNVVDDFAAYGYNDVRMPKFKPTPYDVSDCLNALAWCKNLSRQSFSYLWWRSFDVSFAVIAARIGRSDETARRRYIDAVTEVWGEANRTLAEQGSRNLAMVS